MPADPKNQDSLDSDNTFMSEGQVPPESEQSLGDAPTFISDGDSSVSDLDQEGEGADLDLPLIDLDARYEIEKELGKGGMGKVLLATDTRLGRKVAIKRMLGDGAKSRAALSRFFAEAKAIAQLDHDNIVDIYDYGRAADGPFLIMQYIDGGSLLDRCREGALPLEEAVELTCLLCGALGMAHDAGVIHRDIKPANVLLTKDGSPRLTDFGLVRDMQADHGKMMAGVIMGTLDFMPPEQRRDASLTDARSDLWALAATLYQMVTGRSPKIIRFKNVPQALQDVLEKALEDDKDDRYQTAGEFQAALEGSLAAEESAQVATADLGAGECPQCGVKNDSTRKFCNECAKSLRISCLECEQVIPVWDKVCGECGGKQAKLVEARCEQMDTARKTAESLRSEHKYEDSLRVATSIVEVDDVRLIHLKEWSVAFIAETEREREQQIENVNDHFAEAKKHREAFDYPSAIQAMELIPEVMWSIEMSTWHEKLHFDHDESVELIRSITKRIQSRDLANLLDDVNRAVELRQDRVDLQKLQTQLNNRQEKTFQKRDGAYEQAKKLLSKGKAKEALQLIDTVKTQNLKESDVALREELQQIVTAENELITMLQEAKTGDVVDPEEMPDLLAATEAYLIMNPAHKNVAGMQEDLVRRLKELRPEELMKSATIGSPPPRVSTRPTSVNDALLHILHEFNSPGDGIYILEGIPDKKLANARRICELPRDEEVLLLVDHTVFGSARNCLLVTAGGIYYRNDWTASTGTSTEHIPFNILSSVNIDQSSESRTEIAIDHHRVDLAGATVSVLREVMLLQALQEYSRQHFSG
jgi:serine/threonine protein kinase